MCEMVPVHWLKPPSRLPTFMDNYEPNRFD